MRNLAPESRQYEMMIVVAPTVAEEGLQPVIERVSGYVNGQSGTVASVKFDNPWGRRRLAYPIDDHRDAFYVLFRFDAPASAVVDLERDLRLDEQVIRHLVVRYDEMTEHEERPPRTPAGEAGSGFAGRRAMPPAEAAVEPPAEAVEPVADEARGPEVDSNEES